MSTKTSILLAIAAAVGVGLFGGRAEAQLSSYAITNGNLISVCFTNGSGTWTVPAGVTNVDFLVVGGGGGGGYGYGAGGGAGGMLTGTVAVVAGSNYTVVVGTGGVAGTSGSTNGGNGASSTFGSTNAIGGGGGGAYSSNGNSGGSGGGGGGLAGSGGAGTAGQGNNGGAGGGGVGGGGGGGAGAVGQSAAGGKQGGVGLQSSISGSATYYAQGGCGYGVNQSDFGGGGSQGANGRANSGGGGGAYTGTSTGGGGSGIVIVRYAPPTSLSVSVTAPTAGQVFLAGSSVTATVSVAGGQSPYTVTFYTNSASAWSTNNASTNLFAIPLGALGIGTYTNYAKVTDSASATNFSSTNTFSVVTPPASFFWTNAASGAWGTAGNWTNDAGIIMAPVSAGQTNYTLNFNNAGTYTASNDLPAGFLLNQLNFGGATATLVGASLTLTNNGATLPQVSQNSAAAVTVNNDLLLGANTTFGGSGAGTQTVAGAMSGPGGLTKTGTGTLTIASTNNSYSGATVISNGTLRLAEPAPGTAINVAFQNAYTGLGPAPDGGTTWNTVTNSSTLPVSLLNSLGAASGVSMNQTAPVGWYNYVNNPTKTLTLLDGAEYFSTNVTYTFTGLDPTKAYTIYAIAGKSYTDTRTGYFTLNGVNSSTLTGTNSSTWQQGDNYVIFSGVRPTGGQIVIKNTFVSGGVWTTQGFQLIPEKRSGLLPTNTLLSIASSSSLDLGGISQTIASLSDSGGGGGVVTNSSATSATLTINPSSGSTSFSGSIRGGISLVKSGIGTQVLAGANAYAGGTTVSNGALLVNGSITGAVTVAAGATLGGTGTVSGVVTVQAGGTNAPGATAGATGTLTVNGSVTNAGAFEVVVDDGQAPACGKLAVGGNLNISGATLKIISGSAPAASAYVIASYGTLSGAFAATNNLPAGYVINTNYNSLGQIALVNIDLVNLAATNIAANSAWFNASLRMPATNADVLVYWGPSNGTNNPAAWSSNAFVGSFANVASSNLTLWISGLAADTDYYCTFRATNSGASVWASPSVNFRTLPAPTDGVLAWDGGSSDIGVNGNGASDGGGGTWNNTLTNWDQGSGLAHTKWANGTNVAVFGGTAGTVTNMGVTIGGLRFTSVGYVIASNTLTFGAAGSIRADTDATIASTLGGSSAVTKTGAGALTLSGDSSLTGLFGVHAGTVVSTTNWVGNGRSGQQAQVGGFGSAALWTNTTSLTIGSGAAGFSNTFTVASQGVLRVNGGITVGTNAAAFNSLVVTNGGQAFSTNAASWIGAGGSSNSVQVLGVAGSGSTLWDLGGWAGTIGRGTSTGNALLVSGPGALVTNVGITGGRSGSYNGLTLGYFGESSSGNSLIISNGGQVVVNSGWALTDLDASGNRIFVDNGTLTAPAYIVGWANSGAAYGLNNTLTVTNGGTVTATGASGLALGNGGAGIPGYGSSSNTVTVAGTNSLGAKATINLNASSLAIGAAAGGNNNLVLIGNGGIITNAGAVTIGSSTAVGNSLVITNGGQLWSTSVSMSGSGGNSLVIGGSGGTSHWSLGGQTLTIGSGGGVGNVLRVDGAGVTGGAVVANGGLIVGSGGSRNSVVVTNGAQVFFANDSRVGHASGSSALSNTLTIATATYTGGSNRFHVGWADGGGTAAYNQLHVGAGGLMTNVGYFAAYRGIEFSVGVVASSTAYSNQMVVTDGGKVFTLGNLAVGRVFNNLGTGSASSNSLLIANGGLVNVPGGFFVGADSTDSGFTVSGTANFNSVTITNGGELISGADSYIGLAQQSGSVMNNNTATIGGSLNGTNATWNLGGKNLYVGNRISGTATGNVLTVSRGGVVTNVASLVVPATNTLSLLAGGQIYAGSVTNAGPLTVGIDDAATPACGRLTVSGNLNITGATLSIVTNGAPNGSTYVIASCGALTGTFAVTNGMPYGYRLNCAGNQIALEPIPPPTLVSLNPANNATEIPLAPALAATLNTNIALVNGGVITLTNLTAGATFATITLPDPQVTAVGAVLTITPASSLAYSSQYAVLIGTNAVKGLDTITMFAGITNDTTWRFTTMAPGVSILNQAASALTPTSATFNATLAVPAGNADVQVFWGPTDGTNNPAAWSNNAYVGSWANVTSTNISLTTNGFTADTRYYYTFRATNATTSVWGSPSTTFATLRPLAAAARYWDGGTTNIPSDGDGISQGNSGTWNATTQNWDAGVSSHVAWDNTYSDVAIFAGTAGLVTLASGVTVGGLQFDTAGYVLTNNILTFGAAGSLAVNADATLFTPIAGSAAVAKTGAGTLTNSGDNTLTGLFSVQAGTLANTANWVGNGRSQQKVQVGGAGAAALWTNSIGMTIGTGAAGVSNTFMVASQGVLRVNGGIMVGTNAAAFNSLVITNGGQVFSTATNYIGYGANSNSVLVMGGGSGGPTSFWNLGGQVLAVGGGYQTAQASGTGNVLRIDGAGVAGGAVVTNVTYLNIGGGWNSPGANGNTLIITNGGKLVLSGETRVGDVGQSRNRLLIDGGAFSSGAGLFVGLGSAATGGGGGTNSLTVANGGSLSATTLWLGSYPQAQGWGCSSNTVTVAATNSTGAHATINLNGGNLAIGNGQGASNNWVTIGAGGIITNVGSLTVAATNRLSLLPGGQVYASAATNAGTLTVGLDDAVSPGCGHLTVSGNLNIAGATLTFDVTGTPAQAVYVIASYGTLTGTFAATNGLPPDGSIVYDFGGAKQVALVVQARGTVFRFR